MKTLPIIYRVYILSPDLGGREVTRPMKLAEFDKRNNKFNSPELAYLAIADEYDSNHDLYDNALVVLKQIGGL